MFNERTLSLKIRAVNPWTLAYLSAPLNSEARLAVTMQGLP